METIGPLENICGWTRVAIGDFNTFLNASEKKSRRPSQTSQVEAFSRLGMLWNYANLRTWDL